MMVLRKLAFIPLCLAVVVLFGCGKGKRQKQVEQAEKEGKEFAEGIGDMVRGQREAGEEKGAKERANWFGRLKGRISGQPGGAAKPVEEVSKPAAASDLKAFFPATLAGMKRSALNAEQTAVVGVNLSHAEATYRGNGREVQTEITDMGGAAGSPMMAGMYPWTKTDINRESPSAYERTTTFSGYRAFESYDKDAKSGSLLVLVARRFIVEARGTGVGMDVIKPVLGGIDLSKLETMK
jgi:hypothetical protein